MWLLFISTAQKLCFNLRMTPLFKQNVWEAHIGPSGKKKNLKWDTGLEDTRQIYSTADLFKPQTAPGPALPEEHGMEMIRMATKHRITQRRLMLHIKQTKEIPNLIVSHSIVHPNISKSDSLSLLESKTWYNQISPNLFHDLWSGNISLTLSILLKEIFICHSKSNLVSAWFSKHLVGVPHIIGLHLHHRCSSNSWIILEEPES